MTIIPTPVPLPSSSVPTFAGRSLFLSGVRAVNAFLVIVMKIPTFVATVGTMFIMQGITSWYNGGKALTINSIPGFAMLGQGYASLFQYRHNIRDIKKKRSTQT